MICKTVLSIAKKYNLVIEEAIFERGQKGWYGTYECDCLSHRYSIILSTKHGFNNNIILSTASKSKEEAIFIYALKIIEHRENIK